MQRRKFLVGMGSLAAGGAATLGTGAYEGAYIYGDRSLEMDVTSDENAYLSLIATSPFASYEQSPGGWERGNGGEELKLTFNRLNANMDSRFDDVFRVRNTTGSEVVLKLDDFPDWNEGPPTENALQFHAQDPGGGTPVRLDDGSSITLGAGEYVEMNVLFLLGQYTPNGFQEPHTIRFTADGTDANA